ncbi:MAG: maltose ABC transporter substrate-binding protein [Bacillota bacterium]
MKKSTIKMLSLVLVLVLMVSMFAACAKKTEEPAAATPEATPTEVAKQPVTLKIWHAWTGAEEEALKEATTRYTANNSHVTFELLYTPSDSFKDKVTAALQTGDSPDLFFGAHDWVGPMATGDLLEPVDSYVADVKGDYIQSTYDATLLNGNHYGFPMSMEAVVLIYNKDLVATPPTTISEMLKIAKDNTKDDKFGLVVDLNNTFYNTYGFIQSFGGSAFKEDGVTPNLDSQGFIDYVNWWSGLINKEKVIPKGLDYGTAQALFLEGKSAFWINGPWCFGDIEKSGVNWGAAVLPKNDTTGKDSKPFIGVKVAYLPKASANKEEAANFAKFLTGAEMQQYFNEKVGVVSANNKVKSQKWSDNLIAEAAALGTAMPVVPEMGQIWQPAKDFITAVVDSGKPAAEEAVKANEAAINGIKQMKGE